MNGREIRILPRIATGMPCEPKEFKRKRGNSKKSKIKSDGLTVRIANLGPGCLEGMGEGEASHS